MVMWKEVCADRLVILRKEKGLSQRKLGAIVGISISAISSIEHGRQSNTMDLVIALADYFGVSLDYLTGRSDDPTSPVSTPTEVNLRNKIMHIKSLMNDLPDNKKRKLAEILIELFEKYRL